ncbi:hypothetical protein BOX15_Mlig029510g1 [Macrostomum lignano]|uniref:Cytoplasmic FMR1-interacting protein n=1 Tax=Macrostomum lignano TaxID=282301 RepID=A0A267EFE8_9PLAT|nr:hypothetical protein BOX15_Mlig029510g1 [Macrostomum lignano]
MSAAQSDGQVTIVDAIRNVDLLDNLDTSDDVYNIEAAPVSLLLKHDADRNFQDRSAYVVGVAKYMEEAASHAEMTELLKEGEEYAVMLYTWRSCSRALPQIRSNEQSNKGEIHERTVEVLQPYAVKLMNFMLFQARAIGRFCQDVRRLCLNMRKQDFVSEAYLLTMGKMLDMFAVLDELKNMKASMKNDYSHYKRAAQTLRRMTDPSVLQDAQNLTMFLAEMNKIRKTLKEELQKIDSFELLFAEILNTAVLMYETKQYVFPSEKHLLVKVIGFCIFLINTSATVNVNRLDSKKRISLAKVDSIFKQCQVVNLYGDMSISPFDAYVAKSDFYEPSRWPECRSGRVSVQGALIDALPRIRQEYASLMSELAKRTNLNTTVEQGSTRSDADNRKLYDLALKALCRLGGWNLQVLDAFTWKLANLSDLRQNPDMPKDAEDYAKAVQYNYTSAEKFALVELVSMVKSVQAILLRMESILTDAVKRTVYRQLQIFVHHQLVEPLRHAVKKKKEVVRSILVAIRTMAADRFEADIAARGAPSGVSTKTAKRSIRDDSASQQADDIRMEQRPVAPNSTQLYMVRTMLESLAGRGNSHHTLRKDVDPQLLRAIEEFNSDSFFWPYLLNYTDSLQQCCDLSQLWYREFYLEMTNGARIQFDIDMSMPWLLTKHLLESRSPAFMEFLLYPMDLYNDSAFFALTRFKRQFLYDEIEAEANLAFDQLVICLSDHIFSYYKNLAASIHMDEAFRSEANARGARLPLPPPVRYSVLIGQRHVSLLGRSIDLNRLISQRCNKSLLASLETAVRLFESRDITGILELDCLVGLARLTHRLLSEAGLSLDDFDSLLSEANEEVSSACGKITLHIFWELQLDFVPQYCYNSSTNRFVRTTQSMATETVERVPFPEDTREDLLFGSSRLNKAFNSILERYRGFVGQPHFAAMCRLLGYSGIGTVVNEMLKAMRGLLEGTMAGYVTDLRQLMPHECKLHRFEYTSPGILGYFCAQLKPIITYPDLRTEVLQSFREFGNSLLVILMLEQNLTIEEVNDLKHAAAFQETLPKPFVPPPRDRGNLTGPELRRMREEESRRQLERLQAKFARLSLLRVVENVFPEGHYLASVAQDCDLLTKERLCCGLCIFETVLARLRENLEASPVWTVQETPKNGVMFVDECLEFHRIWSAIQFACCIPPGEHEFTVEELFGEGLQWAGAALLVLLGQERRFELLDFSYHLLRVNKFDQLEGSQMGFSLKAMADRIRKFQILNVQQLAAVGRYARRDQQQQQLADAEQVRCFDCPRLPDEEGEDAADEAW